ncbi:MAG TPA: EAL domain-containing protein [Vicinamibacteria bacterium]|nr:EAL domain-containing protein [Vicinamibacteria bacterium]
MRALRVRRARAAFALATRGGRGPVVLLAASTLALSLEVLWAPRGPLVNVLNNLGGLVPGAVAVWLARHTAHAPALTPRLRRAWRWLTWSFAAFWLGDLVFFLLKVALAGGLVGASAADVFYLSSYPLALVGLLALGGGRPGADGRAAFSLDAAMVTLGGGIVAWQYFVQPTLADPGREMEGLTAAAYVVADVGLLVAFAITGLRSARRLTLPLVLLGLGLVVRLGANALYWYDVLLGPPGFASSVAAALYSVAWLVFGLSAHSYRRAGAEAASGAVTAGTSFVPAAAAALGYGVLAQGVVHRLSLDLSVLVFVGVALTGAVLARQVVAVRAGARLAAERAARANEARFRSLVENASDMILVVGDDARIRFHTPSAERFFGLARDGIDGASLLELVHPEDREVAQALVGEALSVPGKTAGAEWRVRRDGAGWQYVEARATTATGDPSLTGAILTLRSVHERKVLEERLAYQAFHDPLTNLANRVLFTDRLEHALQLARRAARPVSLVFVDLDDFKNVNDSLGHAAGDQLLVEVARRLLGCVRAGDTAARLGGDEFAVLVEEGGGVEIAIQVAERLQHAVRLPFAVAGREIVLGASLGIASSEPGETAGDLLRNADVAMYRAKRSGKGQVVRFEAGMQAAVRERLELEGDLRGAVERGELALVYQPIVALATGRVVGAEALLRWDHPRRGRLRPAEFFPAAESAGLMAAIETWVVEEACRRAGEWPTIDEPGQLPLLSVNVSALLLAAPRLAPMVERAVAESGLPSGRLVLEITEGAAVEDVPTTFRAMRRLRATGVRLALDDFGTGYSSLSYLGQMPVDVLKLDKRFVDGVAAGSNGHLLTRGILDLARALGKLVVAEGIERPEQAARLREYGCTLGQGFLFARPVEADEMRERLAADVAELV